MDALGKAPPSPGPSFPWLGYLKCLGGGKSSVHSPHMGLAERRRVGSPGFLALCDVKPLTLSVTQFSYLANGERLLAIQQGLPAVRMPGS